MSFSKASTKFPPTLRREAQAGKGTVLKYFNHPLLQNVIYPAATYTYGYSLPHRVQRSQ